MNKFKLAAVGLCLGLAGAAIAARPLSAAIITGTPASGLSAPDVVIDFEQGALVAGTNITNQFTGVTFGPTYILADIATTTFDNVTGRFLINPNTTTAPGNILFGAPVTAAGFNLRTSLGTTTFEAYSMGSLVESFTAATFATGTPSSDNFYGFQNIVFDEIRFSKTNSVQSLNLDNLQFINATAVPEPGTLALFALGLAAIGFARRRQAV